MLCLISNLATSRRRSILGFRLLLGVLQRFQAAFLYRGKAGQGGCLRLRAYHSNSNLKMGKNVVATRLPSREAA